MRPNTLGLLVLGLAAGLPANADEIYRWVDHRGVINYANHRPEVANGAVRVETTDSRLNAMAAPSGRGENSALPPPPPLSADFPSDVDRATMARAHSALPPRRSGELR